MNFGIEQDDPSITITRRSKTPESPRAIHPPAPSNIPVLQHQNDLLFNLVTSHTSPPFAVRNLTAMDHEIANLLASQQAETASEEKATEVKDSDTGPTDNEQETTGTGEATEDQVTENNNQSDTVTVTEQQPDNMDTSETVSSTTQPESSATTIQPTAPTTNSNPFTEAEDDDETAPESNPIPADNVVPETTGSEVNYQALLDRIVASSTASNTATEPVTTSAETSAPNGLDNLVSSLITSTSGLPPRPPPQDQPNINSNYATEQDIRSFHHPQAQTNTSNTSDQSPNVPSQQPPFANPGLASIPGASSNGLPPPPLPSFQQHQQQQQLLPGYNQQPQEMSGQVDSPANRYDDNKRWPPNVQQMYEEFLRLEEIYTKDGSWDKFPPGSRLFVGNLPTEVVTKRDIFNCFFRFGKIAQISIKQAYGFVQFMDKEACTQALHGEQGAKIKDRAMHLEVSKPPKSRGGGGGAQQSGQQGRRRSRSPENRRPGSAGLGRNGRYRDDGRRRDDYRPGRSPSPRGLRRGDDFRDRSPGRYRDRSRSPRGGRGSRYGRSPSPRRFDDDDGVPLPRRHPRDVPDVQILLIDELDKPFIDYLEKAFRDRGLRTGVLYLPQVPISLLVKRQILEGVQGIVRVDRATRNTGRIPVQVFDRTAGAANVRFDEYDNLDANTAAELVVRAKAKEATAAPQITPQYSGGGAYPPPQYGIPALQQAIAQQPNIANLISSLDGASLQKLLGAMQQPGANPAAPSGGQSQPDIQALLGSLGRQSAPQQGSTPAYGSYSQPPPQAQQPAYGGYPATQQQQQQGPASYGQQYSAPSSTPNVQGVLDRLGRWKQ